jgi:hypothetical protein
MNLVEHVKLEMHIFGISDGYKPIPWGATNEFVFAWIVDNAIQNAHNRLVQSGNKLESLKPFDLVEERDLIFALDQTRQSFNSLRNQEDHQQMVIDWLAILDEYETNWIQYVIQR